MVEYINVTKLHECNPERVLFDGVVKKLDWHKVGTSSASPKTYFLNLYKCYELDLKQDEPINPP